MSPDEKRHTEPPPGRTPAEDIRRLRVLLDDSEMGLASWHMALATAIEPFAQGHIAAALAARMAEVREWLRDLAHGRLRGYNDDDVINHIADELAARFPTGTEPPK